MNICSTRLYTCKSHLDFNKLFNKVHNFIHVTQIHLLYVYTVCTFIANYNVITYLPVLLFH